MGVISDCKVDTTDVSSQGCGAIMEGVELWTEPVKLIHIHCLEFLAISLALKHFLLQIKGLLCFSQIRQHKSCFL